MFAVFAVLGLARGAWAQVPPPPAAAPAIPPVEGTPAVPVEAPPPAPSQQIDLARPDEIEQLARISARKHELLEEEAAKKAKEEPKVTVDDKGFSMRLPDNTFVLRIRGLVQGDARFFVDNQNYELNDTFLIRKFRPHLEGTLFSVIDFRLMPEFAGTVQILDGYVDFHPWEWLRLRVGKYKGPIGLERLQGDADRVFLEQTLASNLYSQREVGAQLWGDIAGGLVHYVAGIANGSPDNTAADTDTSRAKDFLGRLFIHPFRTEGLKYLGNLGVGLGAGIGNRKGRLPTATSAAITLVSPFRTSGQLTFFQYLAPATDATGANTVFGNGLTTHINPQLYYYLESFGLLAEYLWLSQGVQLGNTHTNLQQQAASATLSYTINGRENYDGTTPYVGFDPAKGAWGALVLGVRWNWLKIDDATFGDPNVPGSVRYASPTASARSAQAYGLTVAWVPRRSVRYAVSYEYTSFEGGAGSGMAVTDRPAENAIIGRAQANF